MSHEPCLPCGATGQRRDRSLPRPTWLPDGRSWVNSSSMSELGIVCRRLTYLIPCSHLSRKSSRASPYRIPGKFCCDSATCDSSCLRKAKRKLQQDPAQEDPYELLQKLLRDGSLVNEAVRRVQLGLTPKQRYFYESDEDSSPVLRLYSQES
jgi:hypothetical protein